VFEPIVINLDVTAHKIIDHKKLKGKDEDKNIIGIINEFRK
jgi:hypothetical protein